MTGFVPLAGLLVGSGLLLQGLAMRRAPDKWLGRGIARASDPRTVRQFGLAYLVLGALVLALGVAGVIAWARGQ